MTNEGVRAGIGVMTIRELTERARDLFGPRVFLQRRAADGGFERWTFADTYDRVVRVGAALAALGVKRGARVAVIGENRPEWAAAYLAAVGGAATAVPLDPKLKAKEIASILEQSGAEVVVASPTYAPIFPPLKAKLPRLREILSMGDATGEGVRGWEETLAAATAGDRAAYLALEPALDDLAVLLFTSGTSGKAKAVMLTHRNLGANVDQVYRCLPFGAGDVFLSLLPLHHTFEATAGMLTPLAGGSAVTYARSYKSKEIVEDIRDAGVTMMCGVPLLYEKMLAGINRAVADAPFVRRTLARTFLGLTRVIHVLTGGNAGKLFFAGMRRKAGMHTMRMFISGAAPLKPEISRAFYFFGLPLLQGYGLTETAPVVSVNPLDRIKFGSSGVPLPGLEVRVHQPDAHGVGEVIVRGDNVMVGYLDDPAQTAAVLRDGWLFTGDAGWLDRDGYIYITGRVKNVIVTAAGKNVHPEEVEAELDASPAVAEAAVMPMRDAAGREVVGAVIYPDYEYLGEEATRRGEAATPAFVEGAVREAVNECCRALADYKRVRVIKIRTEEFPKTTTLKIKRYLFRDGEQAGES